MPIDKDIVLAKCASIDRCLKRIEKVVGKNPERIDDIDILDIVTLNLQRAAQLAIDLANHLVAAHDLGLPTTLKEPFVLLQQHRSLSAELSLSLQRMVGFRNIAVHDYEVVNPEIVKSIVANHLNDLRVFCAFALSDVQG